MDIIAEYRLLEQGDVDHEKYLLFEKAYRNWSQLAIMTRTNSVGPYSEQIVDVPVDQIGELLGKVQVTDNRYDLGYSEARWIKTKKLFLVRISMLFLTEDIAAEIFAVYQPDTNQCTFRESSWRTYSLGGESQGFPDE